MVSHFQSVGSIVEKEAIKDCCQCYLGKSEVESECRKEDKGVSRRIKEEEEKIEYNSATQPVCCKIRLGKYLHSMLAKTREKDRDAVNAINGTAH